MSKLKLAFAGTPEFAVPALDALCSSAHVVAAVLTQPDRRAGRGRELKLSAVKNRALELGLPVFQPPSLRPPGAQALLQDLGVDLLIVAAYGLILPPAALRSPRLGCINIHASLLPRWRGAAPVQRAIMSGDAQTGITIMRMDAGLDTGPMIDSAAMPIEPTDTAQTLQSKLSALGARMIVAAVDAYGRGTVLETPQPEHGVTYAPKIEKAEATVDWGDEARAIERRVRAFNPWPVAQTNLDGAPMRIWQAELASAAAAGARPGRILRADQRGIEVACGEGTLRITRLQLPGRTQLGARDFLASQPNLPEYLGA